MVENVELCEQDVMIAGPSEAKTLRIENRTLLKEEITSEIERLLLESQKGSFMLKPKTRKMRMWKTV